jgi:internalin A
MNRTPTAHPHEAEMSGQPKPITRAWRRYLRFSVRGLIIVVLVIGGWLGWIVRGARIQREAVAAIEKADGFVTYDWEWRDGKRLPRGKPWAPQWLVDLIGVDYFGHVTDVWLGPRDTDRQLAKVAQLDRTERLFCGSGVTDLGLAHLKGLKNLSVLLLNDTQVTEAGLKELERSLPGTNIVR